MNSNNASRLFVDNDNLMHKDIYVWQQYQQMFNIKLE